MFTTTLFGYTILALRPFDEAVEVKHIMESERATISSISSDENFGSSKIFTRTFVKTWDRVVPLKIELFLSIFYLAVVWGRYFFRKSLTYLTSFWKNTMLLIIFIGY